MSASSRVAPRILMVIGQLDVGGAERHIAQVAPALRERGFDVSVFVLKPGGALAAPLAEAGVPIVAREDRRPGLRGLLQSVAHLARQLHRGHYDVVHFFLPAAYLLGMFASLGAPVRRVMSRRSLSHYQQRYPGVRLVERALHRCLAAALANSRAVAADLKREGVEGSRLGVIYNGVVDRTGGMSREAARASLGLGDDLVMVMLANLIPYKGHADLLTALALAERALPRPWTMLFAGRDDGIGAALRAQADALGIAPQLRWLGPIADVGVVLAAADIAVLASHEEGFSNAVLEGMAAGLPMLVTDVGGNAEAVVNGECGYVVPARQPAALAAALRELARSPADRVRMGRAARERARRLFTVDACVERYATLYRNLVAGVTPPLPSEDTSA